MQRKPIPAIWSSKNTSKFKCNPRSDSKGNSNNNDNRRNFQHRNVKGDLHIGTSGGIYETQILRALWDKCLGGPSEQAWGSQWGLPPLHHFYHQVRTLKLRLVTEKYWLVSKKRITRCGRLVRKTIRLESEKKNFSHTRTCYTTHSKVDLSGRGSLRLRC